MTVKELYDLNPQKEWDRLSGNSVEFDITVSKLSTYISPGCTVLDIGGGPGRYSIYFAQRDCDVTLMDVAPKNIEFAEDRAKKCGVNIKTICADICGIDAEQYEQYDVVLCMGPLYCLEDIRDRVHAINRVVDLVRLGGFAFISYTSLFGPISYCLREDCGDMIDMHEDELYDIVEALYSGDSMQNPAESYVRHYASVAEIEETFKYFCNMQQVEIFGQESFLANRKHEIESLSMSQFNKWVRLGAKVASHDLVWKTSEHVMVVGRKAF